MDEETINRICAYRDVVNELKVGGIPALEEVGLRQRRERLESELGEDLLSRFRRGEFDRLCAEGKCDVLVLTASPEDLTQLDLETETKWIREECEAGKQPLAVAERFGGVDQIGKWLRQFNPKIVHFAGHGEADGTVWLEKEDGSGISVKAEAIADLMRLRQWRLDAVFLNACWTETAATPFLDIADWVIGTRAKVGDISAKKLARGFYRGVANADSVPEAFQWALGELKLENRSGDVVKLIRGNRPLSGETVPVPPRVSLPQESEEVFRGGRETRGAAPEQTAKDYPLWFGTNRVPLDTADFSKGFGSDRDDKVWYGTCKVTIPKAHKVGGVGSPWWRRILSGDDRLRLNRESMHALESAAFWEAVRQAATEHVENGEEEPMAMVFVHGYNVSFEESAIRAAQIGCDLRLPGPMAFYSWPSKGRLDGYLADSNTVLGCVPFVMEFLRGFVSELHGEVKKVHVLARSMGNRLVLDAVHELNRDLQAKVFDQIVLAAADVDRQRFLQYASAYREIAAQTTMYVSDRDRALRTSEIVNDSDRAGYFDPISWVEGIDTIRAQYVSQGWLGHGYYAEARPILTDIYQMIHWGAPPARRSMIDAIDTADDSPGRTWELLP